MVVIANSKIMQKTSQGSSAEKLRQRSFSLAARLLWLACRVQIFIGTWGALVGSRSSILPNKWPGWRVEFMLNEVSILLSPEACRRELRNHQSCWPKISADSLAQF
jgi:hypothetical protein